MTTEISEDTAAPGAEPAEPSPWARRAIITLGLLTGMLLASSAALAYDRTTDERLLPGVEMGGVDLGGRSEDAVRRHFAGETAAIGERTVTLRSDDVEHRVTLADLGLRADVDDALAAARADRRTMALPVRMWNRILGRDVGRSYAVRFEIDPGRADAAVRALGDRVDRPPVDAKLDTTTGFVKVVPAVPGRTLDRAAATASLLAEARSVANAPTDRDGQGDATTIELAARPVDAAVTGYDKVILVRLGENKLYFYEGGEIRKTYSVATGSAKHPTPRGQFKVIERRRNPTWVNPDPRGWGRSMPRRIGPGPSNPLGTRALRINSPAINIHGTSNLASLGHSVSHGCVRMAIRDSEELFELVPVDTPVIILRAAPAPAPPPAASTDPIDDQNIPIDLAGQG